MQDHDSSAVQLRRIWCLRGAIAFALLACASSEPSADASQLGPDTAHDTSPDTAPDVATLDDASAMDAVPLRDSTVAPSDAVDVVHGTGALFAPCRASAECASGTCLTAWPGGICSRRCANDTECTALGRCHLSAGESSGTCLPLCTIGGMQCNSATACRRISSPDPQASACIPSCSSTPTDGLACGTGLTCDLYTGGCVTTPTSGFDNGAGCTADAQCRSRYCLPSISAGRPLGFIGGYCVSYARGIALSSYRAGQALPQSNCPPASAAIPYNDAVGVGDSFACYKRCTSHDDCRQGYECVKAIPGGVEASDGVCLPIDCADPAPGRYCPGGTTCITRSDGVSRCG